MKQGTCFHLLGSKIFEGIRSRKARKGNNFTNNIRNTTFKAALKGGIVVTDVLGANAENVPTPRRKVNQREARWYSRRGSGQVKLGRIAGDTVEDNPCGFVGLWDFEQLPPGGARGLGGGKEKEFAFGIPLPEEGDEIRIRAMQEQTLRHESIIIKRVTMEFPLESRVEAVEGRNGEQARLKVASGGERLEERAGACVAQRPEPRLTARVHIFL